MSKIKTYKTQKGVDSAVKRLGMHLMEWNYVYHDTRVSSGWTAEFIVDNAEDVWEITDRGFYTKMKE